MEKGIIKTKGFGGVYFWMQRVAEQYRTKATNLIKEAEVGNIEEIKKEISFLLKNKFIRKMGNKYTLIKCNKIKVLK